MAKVFWNEQAEPINTSLARVLYGIRTEDPDDMMLDSVVESDFYEDADEIIALDALIVPFRRLETKMLAMRRVMERNATNITVADMQTTKPFKKNGVTQIVTIFELSDGQTISIFFHNPDTTPAKIAPTDELISWKWLLNKKDVTILVAPEQGKDLNVNDVCRRLLKIAEKNAPAFARANAKKAERMANIETAEKEIESLSGELKKLESDLEAQEVTISDLEAAIALAKATPTKEQIKQIFAAAGVEWKPSKTVAEEDERAKTVVKIFDAIDLDPKMRKLFSNIDRLKVLKYEIYVSSDKASFDIHTYGDGSTIAAVNVDAHDIFRKELTREQGIAAFEAAGGEWSIPNASQPAPAPKQGDSASIQAVVQYLDLGKEAKALFFNEDRSARELTLTAQTGVMIQIASDLGSVQINAFSGVNGDVGAGKRGYFVYQGNEEAVVESGSLRIEDVKAIYNVLGAQWNPQEALAAQPEAVAVLEILNLKGKAKSVFYKDGVVDPSTKLSVHNGIFLTVDGNDGNVGVFANSELPDADSYDRGYQVDIYTPYGAGEKTIAQKKLTVEQIKQIFAAAGAEWKPIKKIAEEAKTEPVQTEPEQTEPEQTEQQKYVDDHFTFVGAGADAMAEALGLGKAAVSKPATIAKPVEDTPNPATEHLDPQDPQYDRKRADSIWLENLKADKVSESPSEIDEMLEGMFEKYENDPSMSPLVDEAALAYSKRVIQKSREVLAKVGG